LENQYNFEEIIAEKEIIQKIGKIDLKLLELKDFDVLYYTFPLIEKLVLEILKLYEYSDIEFYNQGTYRTLQSLKEKNQNLFSKSLLEEIDYFFNTDGIRNKVAHYKKEDISLNINEMERLRVLVLNLLIIYSNSLKNIDKKEKKKIEYL